MVVAKLRWGYGGYDQRPVSTLTQPMQLRGLALWSKSLRWLGEDLRETRMQGLLWVPAALFGAQSPLTAPFSQRNNPRSEAEPRSATASGTRKSAGNPACVAARLLDAQFQFACQLAGQRTGFLDYPNGVASGRYLWPSP